MQEHMGVMADNVGAGYLPSTSSPPASASTVPLPEVGSPNVASSGGGLATARVIRAEQKKFFFDLGSNARGQYLRISEVRKGGFLEYTYHLHSAICNFLNEIIGFQVF